MAVLGLSPTQLKPFPSDGFSSSSEKDRCCSNPHSHSASAKQEPSVCPVRLCAAPGPLSLPSNLDALMFFPVSPLYCGFHLEEQSFSGSLNFFYHCYLANSRTEIAVPWGLCSAL